MGRIVLPPERRPRVANVDRRRLIPADAAREWLRSLDMGVTMSDTSPKTIITTIVDSNGPGGCNAPPIEVGVFRVTRLREQGPTITREFGEPRVDLLDADFDAMTDDEIANIETKLPGAGGTGQGTSEC
jgi:hypothetical protein